MCRMYSSQVSRFAFSDKIRNEVGIIAIQRLFWEGGITARQEPLNQTMVVGPNTVIQVTKTRSEIGFDI